jgi:hypothetical protein
MDGYVGRWMDGLWVDVWMDRYVAAATDIGKNFDNPHFIVTALSLYCNL